MNKERRRCRHCHCYFEVCPKVKKHEYCRKPECQKARKRAWQRRKMAEDETYRRDQKDAQKDWCNNNPDYWKKYRSENTEYTDRNRTKQKVRNCHLKGSSSVKTESGGIVKMDALQVKKETLSGRYQLIPFTVRDIAKMDAIIIEIDVIKGGCDRPHS